jgi:putative ABC transport system permease protein
MHVLPILSTLRRHRTAAALIVLQVAVTCAIVSNAIFLIDQRIGRMNRPSGVVESELLRIQLTGIGKGADGSALTRADLAALAAIPGVKSAANSNMVPFGGSSWNSSASTVFEDPDPPINAAMYMGSENLLETFGVTLVAGRDFTPDEYADFKDVLAKKAPLPSVIVSRGVAETLYPGQSPIGKPLYIFGDEPQTIVGMVEHIARPNDFQGGEGARHAVFFPVQIPYTDGGSEYLLRVDPDRRDEVLAAALVAIDQVDPNRIILEKQTFPELRRKFFKQDRAMAWLLLGVCIALLVVTALGIVGLASFWVQQRTRQIGIRRALGATKGQILNYFQMENFILATVGIILGMVMAYGINLLLMDKYHVARLPASFLPAGAVLLWLLGQIAVLGPALRAAAVPPAVATRSV